MRKIPVLAAAAAALAIIAAPSMAFATSGGPTYTANASNVAFSVNGQNMTCSNTTVTGNVYTGVNPAADIASSSWGGCSYSGQSVTVTQGGTWNLVADSGYTSGTDAAVAGHISNISAHVSTLGGICQFDVTGTAQGTFDESGQVLHVNETASHGGLTVSGVSIGCFGLISNKQKASFSADFAVSAATPINVF